jgi:hypothetical protein
LILQLSLDNGKAEAITVFTQEKAAFTQEGIRAVGTSCVLAVIARLLMGYLKGVI